MRKSARRSVLLLAAAAAATVSLALSGCSPAAERPADEKITLEFWSWIPAATEAAALYTESHPNVTVKVENPADAAAKLSTALKAGTGAPDVAMAGYTSFPQLVGAGGLADLSEYGANDKKSEYADWTWNLVSSGDQVYGIPQDIGPAALVYREDVLKQYGISVPTTWDEFAKAAEELNEASDGTVAIANLSGTWADWFVGLTWQAGSQPWTVNADGVYSQRLNDEPAQKVAKFWGDLLAKGYVTTYPAFSQDLWTALADGKIATSIEAAWGAGGWSQNVPAETSGLWRVADMPQWGGDFAAGNMGGSALLVPEQGTHKQAATDFAIWLTSSLEGTQTQYDISGTFSASKTGLDLPTFDDPSKNPSSFFGGQNVAKVYAKAATGVDQSFIFAPWYPAASDAYNEAFADALAGRGTLTEALDNWQDLALEQAKAQGYDVTD